MVPAVLLLSTLVLHGAAGADVDHLGLLLISSALLIGLLPVVLHLPGVTQSTSEEESQLMGYSPPAHLKAEGLVQMFLLLSLRLLHF